MKTRLLAPENVCLQIIDVQKSLMAKIHEAGKVASTVEFVIQCAGILSIPVVANTQYKKGLGSYVENVEALLADVPQFDKVEFNALANPETSAFIANLPPSIQTIILVGVETHICIYQTAMGLLERGKNVWIVSDGVSSRKISDHREGMSRLQSSGAVIGSSEMLIYELLGKAGTPEFKKILPYIIARNDV
jgi:nicotinamidase-related amidase